MSRVYKSYLQGSKKMKKKIEIKFRRSRFSFKPYLVWKKDFKQFGWLSFEIIIRKIGDS